MTADLIDLWNTSFFIQRGVEVVLFKGRERRSGTSAGIVEAQLPGFNDSDYDDSSSDSSEDSDSDLSDDRGYGGAAGGRGVSMYGVYGRAGGDPYGADVRDARRRRKERKAEKKRRHREKKLRKKALEREKKYALYITCVPMRDATLGGGY